MNSSMQQTTPADLSTDAHLTHAAEPARPNGCPPWCNHHTSVEAGGFLHCRQVEGAWGVFDVEAGDGAAGFNPTFLPPDYREMSLDVARAYAFSIFDACAAVESSSAAPATAGCPSWCRQHTAASPSGEGANHRARVSGEGVGIEHWSVETFLLDNAAPARIFTVSDDVPLTAGQARSMARALIEAAAALDRG